ncbi:MAG TPA: RagB/SusD family nutrient uptake outer membrane protein [Bacteroidales bacterium]|nr:MAG: SusD family protein [Bacteroidetes bacterium ADurb.Bin217]HPM11921.1 RagB/SusD family nutrient uptake outer membrane protein [Bacteroidales bacterium]
MKKILMYITLSLALFACNDDFITKEPLGVSSDATYYEDPDNCRLAVNAMYDPLGWQALYVRNYMMFDMMSDDCEKGGDMLNYDSDQPDVHQIMLFNANSLNPRVAELWTTYYTIITRACAMLDKAPETDPDILKMRAEARFLRAFAYFELVKIFGPVPLVTNVVSPDEAKNIGNRAEGDDKAKGTEQIKAIYEFVISELDAIKGDLPATYPSSDFGKVTSVAVKALLAKAYLFNEDYANAYAVSQELIGADPMANLEPVYHNIFNFEGTNEQSSEVIFSVQMIPSSGYDKQGDGSIKTLDMGPRAFVKNNQVKLELAFGYGLNIPSQTLVNAFPAGDPRLDLIAKANIDSLYLPIYNTSTPEWTMIGKHPKNTGYYSLKPYLSYAARTGNGGTNQAQGKDIILIRWAEVLLNGAEAAFRSGNTADALAWTNAVRTRARQSQRVTNNVDMNLCTYTTGTVPANLGSITITDIKKEKQLELHCENGTRYFDLLRWNKTTTDGDEINANKICGDFKTDLVGKTRSWDDSKLGRLPVPMTQLILHSGGNLIQNPGY